MSIVALPKAAAGLYETMYRIRRFEEEVLRLRLAGDIVGSVHLCNGQEAIYAGAAAALDLPVDLVFSTYRGHGWAIACGTPTEALFAEMLGRATGTNGGRAGSALLSAPRYGFMGENSIVGAGAPIAVGAALAGEFDQSGRVVLTAFGDGALNQGAVHEALNFAAYRSLPVIFFVENNELSEMTPIRSVVKSPVLFKRASAYGMTGARIDGNDPVAVRDAVTTAKDRAMSGGGPVLLEAMTQRIVGHYIGDVEHYRSAEEKVAARAKEPLARARRELEAQIPASGLLDEIEEKVDAEIREASSNATAAPLASPETVLAHLYEG